MQLSHHAPFHSTAYPHSILCREILAENGLDPNSRGDQEQTALHLAVTHGALRSLRVLLESDRINLLTLTPVNETPLVLATSKGHEDIAQFLIDNYTDDSLQLYLPDSQGLQAVHYASISGMEGIVKTLVERGVDVETRGSKLNHTPLMLAAQNGRVETVRVLLERGAKPSTVDLARMTALHHACMADAEECARLILEVSKMDVDSKDLSGCTPLLYCLNNKNKRLEKLLVSQGADLTAALDAGFSDLCYHTITDSS